MKNFLFIILSISLLYPATDESFPFGIILFALGLGGFGVLLIYLGGGFKKTEITDTPIPADQTKQSTKIPEDVLEKEFDLAIDRFISGGYADSFSSNLMLKKGEKLMFDIPGVSYCEERSVKMKGSHQGFSVRVMKGLSYRFGTFEGGAQKKVVELDNGNFILTNKRLIFSGSTKSVEYPLTKIVTIEPLEDGIMVNRTGKTKMEYFLNTANLSITMEISPDEDEEFEKDTVKYLLTGYELRKLIQKILQS